MNNNLENIKNKENISTKDDIKKLQDELWPKLLKILDWKGEI